MRIRTFRLLAAISAAGLALATAAPSLAEAASTGNR